MSIEYLADAQEDHAETTERDVIRKLKRSTIWSFLKRKRQDNQWAASDDPTKRWDPKWVEEWKDFNYNSRSVMRNALRPRVVWVFLEEEKHRERAYCLRKINGPERQCMIACPSGKRSPKPNGIQYCIQQLENGHLDLTVPFVPYLYFRQTKAYQRGLTYKDYLNCMIYSMHGKADEDQLLKIKSKLCRPDLTEFVPSDLTL
jgi:hypothetical protein